MTRRPEGRLLSSLRPIVIPLAFLLFGSPCLAGTDVSVVWHDYHKLAPPAFDVMKRELESIFSDIGVDVTVHRGEVGRYKRFSPPHIQEVHVILQPYHSGRWAIHAPAMGAAIGAYAYIFFPRIQQALGLDGVQCPRKNLRATNLLGRALGRVVAHEIVHIIAPSYPHRSEGLMCASLSHRELTRRRLYLDPMSAAVFVNRLGRKSGYEAVASSLPLESVDAQAVLVSAKTKKLPPKK